jgi:hypothetical protein
MISEAVAALEAVAGAISQIENAMTLDFLDIAASGQNRGLNL